MAPRSSVPADLEALASCIAEYAKSPDFVNYGEGMDKTKVDPAKILQYSALWRSIRKLHPSLLFSQSTMESILCLVAEKCAASWARPLTASEQPEFRTRMARRMRTMARHINQTKVKHPQTQWYVELVGPEPASMEGWFVGYDHELGKAWRSSSTGASVREYADRVLLTGEKPIAVFKDNMSVELDDVTVEELETKVEPPPARQQSGGLWEGERDGVRLRVARRES